MQQTIERLTDLVTTIARSGDPDNDFYYLGGPMTGIPKFNFPRFQEVAGKLRGEGYNIVSPAELDDPETEAAALASPDGAPGSGAANGEKWEDFLSRDLIVCSLPTCVGGIFMEGWHRSEGAYGESWTCGFLSKTIVRYYEDADGNPAPVVIENRDANIAHLRSIDGASGLSSRPWVDDPTWLDRARSDFEDFSPPRNQRSVKETLEKLEV